MTECFHCGDDDHLSYDCPNHTRRRPAPAPPQASGQAADPSPASQLPGYGTPVPYYEPADPEAAHRGAHAIRQELGWPAPRAPQERKPLPSAELPSIFSDNSALAWLASHVLPGHPAGPALDQITLAPRWLELPADPPELRTELRLLALGHPLQPPRINDAYGLEP